MSEKPNFYILQIPTKFLLKIGRNPVLPLPVKPACCRDESVQLFALFPLSAKALDPFQQGIQLIRIQFRFIALDAEFSGKLKFKTLESVSRLVRRSW